MKPTARRYALALAALGLGAAWVAGTGWLDRAAELGRTLTLQAPSEGLTLRAGPKAYLDVQGETRGGGEGCVLTATDNVGTWRTPIGETASGREFSQRIGPLSGHGERIAWLDLECPQGPPTAQPRARRVVVSAAAAGRAEIMRLHLRIEPLQGWLSRTIEPELKRFVTEMKGKRHKGDKEGSWFEFKSAQADNIKLSARQSEGLALAVDLKTTVKFRGEGSYWVTGTFRTAGRITIPFAVTGFDRHRGWQVETGNVRWNGGDLHINDIECDEDGWVAQAFCAALNVFDVFGFFESAAKAGIRTIADQQLSCSEPKCIRERARVQIKAGIERLVERATKEAGPFVATLLGDASLLANVSGLAKEMKLGLSRVKITNRGRGLDASISVDSAWLGAYTPELHTPRRALSNEGSLVVSFVALNRMLAKFFDRPFCTEVGPELRRLGALGSNRTTTGNECTLGTEFLGGKDTVFGWTGLVPDPEFTLPLRVRPLGRTSIELYVADARPFAPVGDTAMGVFARLERTLTRHAGGTWTIGRSAGPGSALRVVLEAMPSDTGSVSAWVRRRYDSIAQLIDPRPGAPTPLWLDVAKTRDRTALGRKIARIARFEIDEKDLTLGDWRLERPQITLLLESNAFHASGDITTE